MKVLATRKDESLFQGLSRTEEISPGNFGFYATWIALAVILSVFVISALYISHIYRTNERNDIAQSAELLAETVDARLSTTSEAVSRYSFSIFHHPNWRLSTRAQGLARRLMESLYTAGIDVKMLVLHKESQSEQVISVGKNWQKKCMPMASLTSATGAVSNLPAEYSSFAKHSRPRIFHCSFWMAMPWTAGTAMTDRSKPVWKLFWKFWIKRGIHHVRLCM